MRPSGETATDPTQHTSDAVPLHERRLDDEVVARYGDGATTEAVSAAWRPFRTWVAVLLRAVRRQHPHETFHIDCNSGYRLSDLALFRRIDEFHLAMIEQSNYVRVARLCQAFADWVAKGY